MAATYHEVWKPAAHDKDLHSRMGQSYASQAFLVMRIALRRETVLALMRLWDRNKQAVRMSLIVATIRKSAVIDALAADRAKRFDWPGVVEQMRADLQAKADKVIELTNKYSEGGSHNASVRTSCAYGMNAWPTGRSNQAPSRALTSSMKRSRSSTRTTQKSSRSC
jgi:hypothetical protein